MKAAVLHLACAVTAFLLQAPAQAAFTDLVCLAYK
jgi:hypothetical protein